MFSSFDSKPYQLSNVVSHPTIDLWQAFITTTKLIAIILIYQGVWHISNGWHFKAFALTVGLILAIYYFNKID